MSEAKDLALDAIERKLEEIQEGILYVSRRQDALEREMKRMDATIYRSIETLRMGAILTVIVLLAFVFAAALPWGSGR